MAQFNLGQVAIVPRGAYAAATTYNPLDAVSYQGGMYLCLQTTTGNAPTNTTYWSVMTLGIQSVAATVSGTSISFTLTLSDNTTVTTPAQSITQTTVGDHVIGTQQLVTNLTYTAVNLADDQVRPIKIVSSESGVDVNVDGVYLVTG